MQLCSDNRCGGLCRDHSRHCAGWAARGECSTNKEYMDIYCSKACSTCSRHSCRDTSKGGHHAAQLLLDIYFRPTVQLVRAGRGRGGVGAGRTRVMSSKSAGKLANCADLVLLHK